MWLGVSMGWDDELPYCHEYSASSFFSSVPAKYYFNGRKKILVPGA